MHKGDIIKGYEILQDFKVAGGMSKVSFCRKTDRIFFIKEFLSPKYPLPDSPGSEKIKAKKRLACEAFEKHHRELNRRIATKVSVGGNGNLVCDVDFFRNGTSYYKVTQKVDMESMSCEQIADLSLGKILLISKSVVHSIRILHSLDIVHGDLKPDNILIKELGTDKYVGKLIDFDDSYFSMAPPPVDTIVGTPEYYSPEQAEYIMSDDDTVDGKTLTLKSDIFTLGIILTEYFTGHKPVLSEPYKATWLCIKNKEDVSFYKSIPSEIEALLRKMLSFNPNDRPDINEVFDVLKKFEPSAECRKSVMHDTPSVSSAKVGLRGKGISFRGVYETKSKVAVSSGLRGKGIAIVKKEK